MLSNKNIKQNLMVKPIAIFCSESIVKFTIENVKAVILREELSGHS